MVTAQEARQFAGDWIRAWNSHDLDVIMSHYAPGVTLTSPVAASLLKESSGTIVGKEAVRNYFVHGLEVYPNLNFVLHDVLFGLNTVVLYYTNHKGTKTAEFMELDARRKVIRVVANYNE
jgi:ketosteroid isomerase-like protein